MESRENISPSKNGRQPRKSKTDLQDTGIGRPKDPQLLLLK